MKTSLSTYAAFRAIALVGCCVICAVRLGDALSMSPAELLRQAQALNLPQALVVAGGPAEPVQRYAVLLCLGFALFAAAFAWRTSPGGASPQLGAGLLVVQVAIGACVESDLLYLVAAELAFVMPHRLALRWLGVIALGYVAATLPMLAHTNAGHPRCNVAGVVPPSANTAAVLDWALELAFQAFAYAVGRFAAAEWRSRQALARAHAQLSAANAALDRAVRTAEQERITARVHQALARHADALQAHLDQAGQQVSGRAAQAVRVAGEQAARLAEEVRRAAEAQPGAPGLDLRRALGALCDGVPSLTVSLRYEVDAVPIAPALAHTVFRLVQEALSNVLRHAGATAMQVRIAPSGDGLALSIADDGRGQSAGAASAGNGLRGMRERVEAHGGRLQAAPGEGGGFAISAWLPLQPEGG
jgi:signal transduction histidine kinase